MSSTHLIPLGMSLSDALQVTLSDPFMRYVCGGTR